MKCNVLTKHGRIEGMETRLRWLSLFLLIFIMAASTSCAFKRRTNDPSTEPHALLQVGINAFRKGDLKRSYTLFKEAAAGFKDKADFTGQCDCDIHLAHVSLSMGQTEKAAGYLEAAEKTALTLNNQTFLGQIYALRGNIEHVSGEPEKAQKNFKKAISIAEQQHNQAMLVSIHNDLGNLFVTLQHYSKALDAYRTSASLGKKNGDLMRAAIALINGARICIADGNRYWKPSGNPQSKTDGFSTTLPANNSPLAFGPLEDAAPVRGTILPRKHSITENSAADQRKAQALFAEAYDLLDEARKAMQNTDNSQYKTTAHINIGLAYMDLAERLPQYAVKRADAAQELSLAAESARRNQNARLSSYALGYLGRLRQTEGRRQQAADLTQKAIYWANKADAPESLYRWQWQYAQILTAQARMADAITNYQQAIATLESIRSEFTNCYGQRRADLRKTERELYQMYVDVLLRHAPFLGSAERQDILKEAREAVETCKVFELREYFNDDCLGAAATESANVDEILKNAVVLYPILLHDRLEIIASFPAKPGRTAELKNAKEAKPFCTTYVSHVNSAVVEKTANAFRNTLAIKTSCQYLPHAKQLYDWLIRPLEQDLIRSGAKTLVFVPDGALRNIPLGALYDGASFLIQSYAVAVTPGLVLANPKPLEPEKINILAVGMTAATRGFDALPGVAEELNAISSLYKTTVLMDGQFSLHNLKKALQNDDYNVVHIASHGEFSEHIEDSFILAADERLTFNDLSNLVGLYRFRDQPLELITLSACETATGNDQAALGLAGIAVKIGARSALATLWAVDDQAAARLVPEFYRQLGLRGVSRATALRQAKQKLLDDPVYRHPGYWSPFILINNWL